MKNDKLEQLKREFSNLVGLKLVKINRVINMVTLNFEDDLYEKELSVHIQCPCRFIMENKIYIGSGDMYIPSSKYNSNYTDFEWDKAGNNLFDENASYFVNKVAPIIAQKIEINSFGDVKIQFTEEIYLEIFVNNSNNEEQWRFFTKSSNSAHIIVTPLDFEYEL